MDNKQIYKRTLGFSLRRLLWDVVSPVLFLALCTLGFMLGEKLIKNSVIGLVIGAIIGLVAVILISRFVSYMLKAGQIAMMTRGVTEGEQPDNVIAEGKKVVKERFLTVAAYFAVTNVIKGIFNQIGRGITKVGESIGGDTGGAIGSAVSSVMQTIVNYLCDCCLGWVFYRKDVEAVLKDALAGVEELAFDFEKLDYISSAGLRVLLSAQKTMNRQGTMKVIHTNEMIREIFDVTGFADILTVE